MAGGPTSNPIPHFDTELLRVTQGSKDTLKILIEKLGGVVDSSAKIDTYPNLANNLAPVISVNSKTGAVTLTASDVGAANSSHTHNYAGSDSAGGAATSADKVNKPLVIQLNGGTTEGTNKFTFDGSTAKTINIAPSKIGISAYTADEIEDMWNTVSA